MGIRVLKIITMKQMDRGLAYAEACFETFRVIDATIFDWQGHWQRMLGGLAEFGIQIDSAQADEIRQHCLREAGKLGNDVLVRITISGGESGWGLTNRASEALLQIQCVAYAMNATPITLQLQSWPFPLKQKSAKFVADYGDTLRALHGATDAQVLFEKDGFLLATATANILLYRDAGWHTPTADAGVLPGRVREFLLGRGLVRETPCPVAWLADCDAMAVCNSGVFIRAVSGIHPIQRSHAMDIQHPALQTLTDALGSAEGVRLW